MLDEPFSNVDVNSAREMVGLLKGMRNGGRTILVVTGSGKLLEGVADEFVWMEGGQIVRSGTQLHAIHSAADREGVQ